MPKPTMPSKDVQPKPKRRKLRKKVTFADMIELAKTSTEPPNTSIQLPPAVIAKKIDQI